MEYRELVSHALDVYHIQYTSRASTTRMKQDEEDTCSIAYIRLTNYLNL